jgi:hypothetical protein
VADCPVVILLLCSLKTGTFERANAFRTFMSVRHRRFGYRNQVRDYGKTEYEHQGCRTNGTRAQNDKRKDFLVRRLLMPSQFCFIYFVQPASLYGEGYVYIDTSDCAENACGLPLLLLNNTVNEIFLLKIGRGAKCWLDVYHWGAGLAVTGRIRDIGQNVLQFSFQTEEVAAPVTATFFPYRIPRIGLY